MGKPAYIILAPSLTQSAVAEAGSFGELQHSAMLGKTFLVGWLSGGMRNSENKADHGNKTMDLVLLFEVFFLFHDHRKIYILYSNF